MLPPGRQGCQHVPQVLAVVQGVVSLGATALQERVTNLPTSLLCNTLAVNSTRSSNPTAFLCCTDLHKVFLECGQFTVAELFLAGPAGRQGVGQDKVGQAPRQGDTLPLAEGEQQREVKLGRRG